MMECFFFIKLHTDAAVCRQRHTH